MLSLNYMREYDLLCENGTICNRRGFKMNARNILSAEHMLCDSWLKSTAHDMLNGKHVRHYKRQLELVVDMQRELNFAIGS